MKQPFERTYKKIGYLVRSVRMFINKYPIYTLVPIDDPRKLRIGFCCPETGDCWFIRIAAVRRYRSKYSYRCLTAENRKDVCRELMEQAFKEPNLEERICQCTNTNAQNVPKS